MLANLTADFRDFFPALPWETAIVRLLLAAAIGGLIGWECESRDKPAGLRTHILVSVAACLFTLLAHEMLQEDAFDGDHIQADPLRLIEAVTSGVAFLAAGSIIVARGSVKGLTTGAGMWTAGAIGVACGLGELLLALAAALITVTILTVLRRVLRPDN